MAHCYSELSSKLGTLEAVLKEMSLWSEQPPSDEALASTEPFAVDTLAFEAWLQFIFLPRMRHLIDAREPLPLNCCVTPMAEEYFKGAPYRADQLIAVLASIDALLSPVPSGNVQRC